MGLRGRLARETSRTARRRAASGRSRSSAIAKPYAGPFANGAQEGGVPGSRTPGVHDVKVHIRGRYDRLGELVPRGFPNVVQVANAPTIARRQRAEGTGRLAHATRSSAHRPRDRQSRLAVPLRPRDRQHAEQLRPAGREADPPRTARSPGHDVRRRRLEPEETPPPHPALGDLSPVCRTAMHATHDRRSGQPILRPIPAATARGRGDPRQPARRRRASSTRRAAESRRATSTARAGRCTS